MRDAVAGQPVRRPTASPTLPRRDARATTARLGRRAGPVLRVAFLLLAGATMVVPFLWMLTTSLKAPGTVLEIPPRLFPAHPTLASYREVMDTVPLGRMVLNSLFVTTTTVLLQLATCALSGYAFARMRWRGRDALFVLYLATLMVPSQVTITPLFILMRQLHWVNTYQALILPGVVSAFGTFLVRQAMLGVPREYEEAAFLDGANHWRVFSGVVLPMVRPALATLTVFAAMGSWNDFLWPLFVINDQELMTLPVGLSLLQGRYETDWNLLMAGAVISVVPIIALFLLAQRAFVNGVVMSGLK